jgi:two-component system, LytTR family, response regulator
MIVKIKSIKDFKCPPKNQTNQTRKKMKTFIVEDNEPSRLLLRQFIKEDNPELEIVGEATTLREARAFLLNDTPQLVLLDIELPDGTSFDLLEELNAVGKIHFDIIFITAFGTQEYLVRALEFSALKYLNKPLNRHEFRASVLKALEQQESREIFLRQINMLIENTRKNSLSSDVIALLLIRGVIEMVGLDEILYISSNKSGGNSTVYLSTSATPLQCIKSIGQFSNLLKNHPSFFQVHESTIINIKALKRFDSVEKIITMRNGAKIIASRRYAKLLKDYLINGEQESNKLDMSNIRQWFHRIIGRRKLFL